MPRCRVDTSISTSPVPLIRFRAGSTAPVPLEEYLRKNPFIVRYPDGTYSYNCYHIPVPLAAGRFDAARLETCDRSGIPLNRESMHKQGDHDTI